MREKRFFAIVLGGSGLSIVGLAAMYALGFFSHGKAPLVLNVLLGGALYVAGAHLGLLVLDLAEKKRRR